jgi:hypothetical protein
MITDKIKCPYCKKNMMCYNSKSCDDCHRHKKYRGRLSCNGKENNKINKYKNRRLL